MARYILEIEIEPGRSRWDFSKPPHEHRQTSEPETVEVPVEAENSNEATSVLRRAGWSRGIQKIRKLAPNSVRDKVLWSSAVEELSRKQGRIGKTSVVVPIPEC